MDSNYAQHLIDDLRRSHEYVARDGAVEAFLCYQDGCRSCHAIIDIDCSVVAGWMNDRTGHPTPLRSTLHQMRASGASLGDLAEALERTFLRTIPVDVFDLPKVTGRGSKHVRPGGPTPFKALAYA